MLTDTCATAVIGSAKARLTSITALARTPSANRPWPRSSSNVGSARSCVEVRSPCFVEETPRWLEESVPPQNLRAGSCVVMRVRAAHSPSPS